MASGNALHKYNDDDTDKSNCNKLRRHINSLMKYFFLNNSKDFVLLINIKSFGLN
jgi:hypothetical protein